MKFQRTIATSVAVGSLGVVGACDAAIIHDCDIEPYGTEGTVTVCWNLDGKAQKAVQWCYDPDTGATYPMSGSFTRNNGSGSYVIGPCDGNWRPNPANDYVTSRNVDVV